MPGGNGMGPAGQGQGLGAGQGGGQGRGSGKGRGSGRGMGSGRGRRAGVDIEGFCVCSSCGEEIPHQRGVLCNSVDCPKCGTKMGRE